MWIVYGLREVFLCWLLFLGSMCAGWRVLKGGLGDRGVRWSGGEGVGEVFGWGLLGTGWRLHLLASQGNRCGTPRSWGFALSTTRPSLACLDRNRCLFLASASPRHATPRADILRFWGTRTFVERLTRGRSERQRFAAPRQLGRERLIRPRDPCRCAICLF